MKVSFNVFKTPEFTGLIAYPLGTFGSLVIYSFKKTSIDSAEHPDLYSGIKDLHLPES